MPLRGVPAATPKSLAFGRGRRHIAFIFGYNLHYLYREDRAPVRRVAAVVAGDYKEFVFVILGKGPSCGFEVFFVVGKGLIDDYYLVHA